MKLLFFPPTFLLNTAEEKSLINHRKKKHDRAGKLLCLSGTNSKIWIGLYINTYAVTKTSNSNTPELWGSLYMHSTSVA